MPQDRERRFGGLDRLFGAGSVEQLAHSHVVVAGIGGVGSWCAEALVRTGVGNISLIDLDHVSPSNINRQLPALSSTIGRSKIEVMAERLADINPACHIHLVDDFVSPDNAASFFDGSAQVIVDCTDDVTAKIALVLAARQHPEKHLFVCGAAGGKTDPLSLRAGDLSLATHDALLGRLRQQLRRHHGWPAGHSGKGRRTPKMGIQVFWFAQEAVLPEDRLQDRTDRLQGLSCAGYGSAMGMTASMGLLAAQRTVQTILATKAS